mgnify:FL=1
MTAPERMIETRRSWWLVPALIGGAAVWVVLVWGWAV